MSDQEERANEEQTEEKQQIDIPAELEKQLEAYQQKLVAEKGDWVFVKTTDGDQLTGRISDALPGLQGELGGFGDRRFVALTHVVRYTEINVPMQLGPGDVMIKTMMNTRPDLEVDDAPEFIPLDKVARFRRANPENAIRNWVNLLYGPKIQEHIRAEIEKKQKELESRMRGSGLALPGDMASIPSGGIPFEALPPHIQQQLRRQMGR